MTIRLTSQEYIGHRSIFYGPAILLHVLKIIYSRKVVFGMIDQCYSETDLVNYVWVSDLYFTVHWFCLFSLSLTLKYFRIKKWRRLGYS